MKKPCFIQIAMGFLPFTFEPLFFIACLGVLMLAVMLYDLRHYIIPNTLNVAIIALYPLAAFFLGLDYVSALMAFAIVLAAGLALFTFGLMGGGDVKLMAALSLWVGFSERLLECAVAIALAGGALALVCVLLRYTLGRMWHHWCKRTPRPRIMTSGEPIPYGVAIAAAFLWLLVSDMVPGLTIGG
jgi:prepilin peptidase CpaA